MTRYGSVPAFETWNSTGERLTRTDTGPLEADIAVLTKRRDPRFIA
jgi:hypothetical protein